LLDEALLDQLQRAAFDYFLERTRPKTGLVADTTREGSPASIAVSGFGLSTYPVAVERGWLTRPEAARRVLVALRFFAESVQSDAADATGFKGFYYHFLDLETGRRTWKCELSLIDTTLLLAGVLTVSVYFAGDAPAEVEIRSLAEMLLSRVDWAWATNGQSTIMHGWKPECGFLHYGWEGYSEATILYVLALASTTHPLPQGAYAAWTTTYQWENLYDCDWLFAGPLFIHLFSHAWIDFRGIRDAFMREKSSDYFENSQRAVDLQRAYAKRNPREFVGYGGDCWGISAGDGPPPLGYCARAIPFGPDDGTLSPPAVVGSLPFAPVSVLRAVRHWLATYPAVIHDYKLRSGFNPTREWVSEGLFGLDQGLIVLMIENHRTGLIWNLMRRCPQVVAGLRAAGFNGGWLDEAH
jgi:hypothetical protein